MKSLIFEGCLPAMEKLRLKTWAYENRSFFRNERILSTLYV